jgi:hypothetical protein
MKVLSIQIIRDLPLYTDEELKTLLGRLTLNMYGADVTEECSTFAITERKRRQALAECGVTA